MFDIKATLKEIDDNIANYLYKAYDTIFSNLDLNTIKYDYYEIPDNLTYSKKMIINDYLFLKVKEYYYSTLFTNLVFLYNLKYEIYEKNVANSIAPILFNLYEKKYDNNLTPTRNMEQTAIEKVTKTGKTREVCLLSQYQELIKKLKKLDSYLSSENNNIKNPFVSSNPATTFQSMIHKLFSYDFYYYNTPFKYILYRDNDHKNIPKDFVEYITLNLALFYGDKDNITTSQNIITKASSILASLGNKRTSIEYNDLRQIIEEKYNTSIDKINLIKDTLDETSYKSNVYYYLFNAYFHNDFFNSYNHPIIKFISKRVSIRELYNETRHIYSNTNNENDSLIFNFSIDESYYYLDLLCLLLEFNVDLNFIDENQFYNIESIEESFYSIKEKNHITFTRLKNHDTIYKLSQDKIKVLNAHLDFIFTFLNSVHPAIRTSDSLDVFQLETVQSLFRYIEDDIPKEDFLNIISYINKELNNLYSNIQKHTFKQFDITDDDTILDRFYLTTYLLKYSFIKDVLIKNDKSLYMQNDNSQQIKSSKILYTQKGNLLN